MKSLSGRTDKDDAGIVWEGVSFVYPASPPVTALREAQLRLAPGDQVAVVGPSGSGKSTTLNVLGLLDRPTNGTYRLFGRDTAELRDRQRAALRSELIGFVFQSFHLLPRRTTLENVRLGMMYSSVPRSQRNERAASALQRVGLEHRMGARVATLSGGERQRAAIARAICHDPRVLLADEPTGNLDQETGSKLLDLLGELMGPDLIQVIVTHNPDVATSCGRRLALVDGHLRELA